MQKYFYFILLTKIFSFFNSKSEDALISKLLGSNEFLFNKAIDAPGLEEQNLSLEI